MTSPSEHRQTPRGVIVVPSRAEPLPVPDFTIAGESHRTPAPVEWETHRHPVHELLWVRDGVMTTYAGRHRWTLTDTLGLWIPAHTDHRGRVSSGADFHATFFTPASSRFAPDRPVCVDITPLLAELLSHLERGDLGEAHRAHTEALVFDLLRETPSPLGLPVPEDPRIAPIAAYLLAHPEDPRTLDEWARERDVSARTLARAFVAETDLSFVRWRQQLRVQAAFGLLRAGASVADAGEAVGYLSTSSFIAMFQKVTGVTPGRSLGRDHREPTPRV